MDPNQIAQMLASGDPKKVKEAQTTLQALGYSVKPDGKLGDTTSAAVKAYRDDAAAQKSNNEAAAAAKEEKARADKVRETELAIEAERVRQAGLGKDVENAAETAKALRRQRYSDDASSGLGMATQSGASVVAPALAGMAGLRFGDKVNQQMDRGQEKRNVTLRGAAEDRVKGLTTREGAVTGARLAGAMPSTNALMRVMGRMAPHAGLAALSGYKGAELLGDVDEEQPFYPRMGDRAAGLGYLGFGGGILKRGIQQAAAPGVSPDAQALSVINSSQLRRNNQPTPEDAGPKLTPRQALLAEARTAGVTGASKMNMTKLKDALAKVGTKTPLIGPAIGGALAYAATPDDAQAADGSGGGRAAALTNAGVVTGMGAGTGYGLDRLARALGSAGQTAMGIGGKMMTPFTTLGIGPEDSLDHQNERSRLAQNYPQMASMIGLEDPAAQVPERAPAGGDGFNTARSLEIPEGIPLPQPDGGDEFAGLEAAAAQDPELAEMIKELIMARMNGGEMDQIPNAMASGQVASQPVASALRQFAQR